jgi:transcriptional regulator with XRE-family HTH domain
MADPDPVRSAITRRMTDLGWNTADLAREAGVDPGTVGDFLNGKIRSPQRATRAAISRALGWDADAIDQLRAGNPDAATTVRPTVEDAAHVMLDLPDEALHGLSEVEKEEVRAAARLAALAKAREIRGG